MFAATCFFHFGSVGKTEQWWWMTRSHSQCVSACRPVITCQPARSVKKRLVPANLPGLRGRGGGRKELQEPNPGWPPSISWHHKLYLEKGSLGVLKNPFLQYLWSSYLAKVFILPQPYAMQGRSRPQACRRQTAKDKEFLRKYQDLFGFDQFRWINLSVVVKI